MNPELEFFLNSDSSKENMAGSAAWVLVHAGEFKGLVEIALANKKVLSMRAAAIVERVTREKENWIRPWTEEIISKLDTFSHPGQKRNFLKIFTRMSFNEAELGLLLDYCFRAMISPKESIAVQAYSMEIIFNALNIYPELVPEYKLMLENGMPFSSKGWQARARNYLSKLSKISGN